MNDSSLIRWMVLLTLSSYIMTSYSTPRIYITFYSAYYLHSSSQLRRDQRDPSYCYNLRWVCSISVSVRTGSSFRVHSHGAIGCMQLQASLYQVPRTRPDPEQNLRGVQNFQGGALFQHIK